MGSPDARTFGRCGVKFKKMKDAVAAVIDRTLKTSCRTSLADLSIRAKMRMRRAT